jgi:alanine racemase
MSTGTLSIDLGAICSNWRALNSASGPAVQTAAVVKADGYGLGASTVASALMQNCGVRQFFVATAEEGSDLRDALGPEPVINVFSGHCVGDGEMIAWKRLVPMINSPEQLQRHLASMPDKPYGVQIDTGMSRLGVSPQEWAEMRPAALAKKPTLVMSHLACADEPDHPMNAQQLAAFHTMTDGVNVPRSLSATGGILLGDDFHFDVTRPGIGLYGGRPFDEATPVVRLSLPVIQTRMLTEGDTVGYGSSWTASKPTKIATLSAGYADGISRALSNAVDLYHQNTPCPLAGRVSMDLLTVDISALDVEPVALDLICPAQGVDAVADCAGTIGYEILTSLGRRYRREWRHE